MKKKKTNRLFYIIRSGNRNHEMVKKREEISEECIIKGTESKWKHAHVVQLKRKRRNEKY